MGDPISVRAAVERILAGVEPLPPLELPLLEAQGCVFAEDVVAESDVPAAASAAIDGFAVRAADLHEATPETPIRLLLVGWSRVGRPVNAALLWGQATGIESGASLPEGADAVISPGVLEGESVVVSAPVAAGKAVVSAGQQIRAGDRLVPSGSRLGPPEIGVLAAAGKATALVQPRVRVAVLAAGELVEPGQPGPAGSPRDAVSYALVAALRDAGAIPYRAGIVRGGDEEMREALVSNLSRADVVVCAGEVFAGGGHDLVTSGLGAIDPLHVEMFPGGDLDAGTLEGKPYFGLPLGAGDALVSFEVLVRPAILRLMGREDLDRPEVDAVLEAPVRGPEGPLFVPVRIDRGDKGWVASPIAEMNGSLLAGLVEANGLAVVDGPELEPGAEVRVRLLRAPAR